MKDLADKLWAAVRLGLPTGKDDMEYLENRFSDDVLEIEVCEYQS